MVPSAISPPPIGLARYYPRFLHTIGLTRSVSDLTPRKHMHIMTYITARTLWSTARQLHCADSRHALIYPWSWENKRRLVFRPNRTSTTRLLRWGLQRYLLHFAHTLKNQIGAVVPRDIALALVGGDVPLVSHPRAVVKGSDVGVEVRQSRCASEPFSHLRRLLFSAISSCLRNTLDLRRLRWTLNPLYASRAPYELFAPIAHRHRLLVRVESRMPWQCRSGVITVHQVISW